jgi:hypothetical protein
MQNSRRDVWVAGALVVTLGAFSGCSKAQHAAPTGAHAGRPAVSKGSGGTAFDLADMVSAVSLGKAPTDIDLKFALRERPAVGEPVDIDIALIPGHELEQIYATFNATDGLEISKGGTMPKVAHPEPGAPISHTLTIVPQRDGIFYVGATVLADSPTSSVTYGFSIPIIAGAGITTAAGAGPPAAKPR